MARIVLKELETEKILTVSDIESLMGRDPACGFVIEGTKSRVVSGRHARIFFQDSAWWIQDMSRNGTVLDDERLQAGQRHALRVGQTIGLGESGPRLRVAELESRNVSETVLDLPDVASSPQTTAPRPRPALGGLPTGAGVGNTAAMRKSEAMRAGLKFEESTEPMSPAPDWLVHVVLRATTFDQQFDARSRVVKVGRSPECTVRVPPEQGASVSRIHAEIAISEGGVVLRDAGSRNGTFLNGVRIESSRAVVTGDQIMLGSGGPTFTIEDLHIVKGDASPVRSDVPGLGGSATPSDPVAVQGTRAGAFKEPPTMPSPSEGNGTASSSAGSRNRDRPVPMTPAPVNKNRSDSRGEIARRIPLAVWLGIGILVIAAAVVIGRISAS